MVQKLTEQPNLTVQIDVCYDRSLSLSTPLSRPFSFSLNTTEVTAGGDSLNRENINE